VKNLNDLISLMNQLYEKKHSIYNKNSSKKSFRFIKTLLGIDFEIFLSGSKRYKYENYYLKTSSNSINCPLCFSGESIIYQDKIIISADDNPFFYYHMLLRFFRKKKHTKDIAENIKLKVVKTEDIICRENLLYEDIQAMCNLALDAQDYYVTLAMRGSGASIPEHVHAHIFPKNQTTFPLLDKKCFVNLVDDKIWVNNNITYALLYKGKPKEIAKFFSWMEKTFSYSSNQIIYVDKEFESLIGVYIPRIKEMPFLKKNPSIGWKFGVFEVLGLFDSKSLEIYNNFDYEQAFFAIQQVTIHDKNIQKRIEKACLDFCKKVTLSMIYF